MKTRRLRNRAGCLRDCRGQSQVETAMTMLVFVLVVLGILDLGRALYAYNFVSYASREGTRYAAVRGAKSTKPATSSDIQNLVTGEATALDPSALTVTTTWAPNNNPGSVVNVQVQYSFKPAGPWLGTLPLTSTSQMVISQ